jgi:disulfide bond formation protein DsbB
MAIAAWWLWQGMPWGFLLAGAGLTFWTSESVGIAVDQWFGHRADATSTWASPTAAWMFAALAAVTLAAAVPFYRAVGARPSASVSG